MHIYASTGSCFLSTGSYFLSVTEAVFLCDLKVAGSPGFRSSPQSDHLWLQRLGTLPDGARFLPGLLQRHLQAQQGLQTQDLLTLPETLGAEPGSFVAPEEDDGFKSWATEERPASLSLFCSTRGQRSPGIRGSNTSAGGCLIYGQFLD